jgi:hypothetical protein
MIIETEAGDVNLRNEGQGRESYSVTDLIKNLESLKNRAEEGHCSPKDLKDLAKTVRGWAEYLEDRS